MGKWLILLLVLGLGLSAVVYRLVFTRIIMAPGPQTSEIVVAAHKLEIGTLVKDVDLKGGQWVGPLPPGVVLKKEDVVGRGVVAFINEGEPIFENRLALVLESCGIAADHFVGDAHALGEGFVAGIRGLFAPLETHQMKDEHRLAGRDAMKNRRSPPTSGSSLPHATLAACFGHGCSSLVEQTVFHTSLQDPASSGQEKEHERREEEYPSGRNHFMKTPIT